MVGLGVVPVPVSLCWGCEGCEERELNVKKCLWEEKDQEQRLKGSVCVQQGF